MSCSMSPWKFEANTVHFLPFSQFFCHCYASGKYLFPAIRSLLSPPPLSELPVSFPACHTRFSFQYLPLFHLCSSPPETFLHNSAVLCLILPKLLTCMPVIHASLAKDGCVSLLSSVPYLLLLVMLQQSDGLHTRKCPFRLKLSPTGRVGHLSQLNKKCLGSCCTELHPVKNVCCRLITLHTSVKVSLTGMY